MVQIGHFAGVIFLFHMLVGVENTVLVTGMIPGSSMLINKGPAFLLRLDKITILILIDRRINTQD